MNYRHILILTRKSVDFDRLCALLGRLCPEIDRLVTLIETPSPAWGFRPSPPDAIPTDAWTDAAARIAGDVVIQPLRAFSATHLAMLAASEFDLIVLGDLSLSIVAAAHGLRKLADVAVLMPDLSGAVAAAQALKLVIRGVTKRERASAMRFLRERASAVHAARLMTPGAGLADGEWRAILDAAQARGIALTASPRASDAASADLLVTPYLTAALTPAAVGGPSVLILPRAIDPERLTDRAIDMPDCIDDGERIGVLVEYRRSPGRQARVEDQDLLIVTPLGEAQRASSRGDIAMPSGSGPWLGVRRARPALSDAAAAEHYVSVIDRGVGPLILFDAELPPDMLGRLAQSAGGAQPLGVRLRPVQACETLRRRVAAAGLPPRVIDASAVLAEGEAPDVPAAADAVRLARVAARLLRGGFAVRALIFAGPIRPAVAGVAALRCDEIDRLPTIRPPAPRDGKAGLARFPMTHGNHIAVELDNGAAWNWLLEAITGSRESLHIQVYMAADDAIGRAVERALIAAAGRGVAVRVLVDSLHAWHGSFGWSNPLIARLERAAGVEVRAYRPIGAGADLEDIKRRDHRKVTVADGRIALIGGRNLSHEYYAGFQDTRLAPTDDWRRVPWLDAGARVEGPAATAIAHGFRQAWRASGGGAFAIPAPLPVGAMSARVVTHHGLRDAYTLETLLDLIGAARSHIHVLNTFPLLLELQDALLAAIGRGVAVRVLTGSVAPSHQGGPFAGAWSSSRAVVTSFVHSRLDPLVKAGGDCRVLVVPHQPTWDAALGAIRPHLHAKLMTVDGGIVAIGSANFDVTASYWENEVMLVVEDAALARDVEARIEALRAGSDRMDRDDPAWRALAARRRWMRYWPGDLAL